MKLSHEVTAAPALCGLTVAGTYFLFSFLFVALPRSGALESKGQQIKKKE